MGSDGGANGGVGDVMGSGAGGGAGSSARRSDEASKEADDVVWVAASELHALRDELQLQKAAVAQLQQQLADVMDLIVAGGAAGTPPWSADGARGAGGVHGAGGARSEGGTSGVGGALDDDASDGASPASVSATRESTSTPTLASKIAAARLARTSAALLSPHGAHGAHGAHALHATYRARGALAPMDALKLYESAHANGASQHEYTA